MKKLVRVLATAATLQMWCFAQNAPHFENLKQITSGGQNAEAYW
jgi:hypothetical protein